MCEVNPEHKQNIIIEHSKKVLYVQVLKAIYRMIKSALRWYKLYNMTLNDVGFKRNTYNNCVANEMKNGSQ